MISEHTEKHSEGFLSSHSLLNFGTYEKNLGKFDLRKKINCLENAFFV